MTWGEVSLCAEPSAPFADEHGTGNRLSTAVAPMLVAVYGVPVMGTSLAEMQ